LGVGNRIGVGFGFNPGMLQAVSNTKPTRKITNVFEILFTVSSTEILEVLNKKNHPFGKRLQEAYHFTNKTF